MDRANEKNGVCKLCRGVGRYRGHTGTAQVCFCAAGIEIRERERAECNVPMEGSRALQIAAAVRRNLDHYTSMRTRAERSMKGYCAFASMSLARAWDQYGIKWTMHSGVFKDTQHVWLVHQNRIIDLTFTQFDNTAARVMVFKKGDSRYRSVKTYTDLAKVRSEPHGGGSWAVIERMARI